MKIKGISYALIAILFLAVFVSAVTFTEVSFIKDDSVGGDENYLERPRGIVIDGDYLYVTSLIDDALSIYDVSNPEDLVFVNAIQDNSQGGSATALDRARTVFISKGYAYVVSNGDDSLSVFDISKSKKITEVGYIQDDNKGGSATALDGADTLYVTKKYAYVSSYNEDAISVIDISDPSNLIEVNVLRNGAGASAIDGSSTIRNKGKYLYVVSRATGDSLSIFEIDNKGGIVELGYIQDDNQGGNATALDGAVDVDISLSGNYAYVVSKDDDSLSIFDVSDPTNIREIGYVQDDNQGGIVTSLDGANSIIVLGNYAYVTAKDDHTFSIFDISDPTNIIELFVLRDDSVGGDAAALSIPIDFFISGDYAYITSNGDHAISVIDISGI